MPQILTNKYNLPQTLVDACKYDTHRTAGDISVTTLIDSPQIRLLKKKNTYEVDVIDNMYMLIGTAMHHILERANINDERKRAFILTAETIMKKTDELSASAPDKADQLQRAANYIFKLIPVFFPETASRYIYEQTMTIEVNGMLISGTFDLFDKVDGILYDYKFTSVYQYIFPESQKKWKQQTNVYAYMIEQTLGLKVNGINIVAMFRNWQEHDLIRNSNYPKQQVMAIPVTLGNPNDPTPWQAQVLKYIEGRVKKHQDAESGLERPYCSGEDRWAKADEWAIRTQKGKRALRKYDSEAMAISEKSLMQSKYAEPLVIEHRPGDSVRCEKFCPVSKFCEQRQEELKNKLMEKLRWKI